MRATALLAAITLMHTTLALPRPDLALRQDGNDLRNELQVFHYPDRNQRTANRDHALPNWNENGTGVAVRGVSKRPERAGAGRVGVVEERFMRNPDYSEGGRIVGGSHSGGGAPDTMPMPMERPGEVEKWRGDRGSI